MVRYRVHRTDDAAAAVDVRSMTEVHDLALAADVAARPRHTVWTDTGLPSTAHSYRVVAVDRDGNVSRGSAVVTVRPITDPRPAPPVWGTPSVDGQGHATLSWTSTPPDLAVLVERSPVGAGAWVRLATWLPRGATTFVDAARAAGPTFDYRLRALDVAGRQNRIFTILAA